MIGLNKFLLDLRRCKGKDEEFKRVNNELANIRSKFNSIKPLNGYHKRKYICKLVYIFLLGYKCEYGLMEAVNLLSSNEFSEKQAGYLFLSVVRGNDFSLMPLVIKSLKDDLSSPNDVFQNLALQFVANSSSLTLADSLADPVISVLFAGKTTDFVRQSAVLALLQLLRMNSDLILPDCITANILCLFSHHNLGLSTATASLMEFLVKTYPSQYKSCMPYCIDRLNKIVSSSYIEKPAYTYYSVTAPWICVKLLQILQNFPAPSDASLKRRLVESLEIILRNVNDTPVRIVKRFEHNNAKFAVIFEAIFLVIKMELEGSIFSKALNILESILKRKEVNFRLVALQTMTRLSRNSMYLQQVKPQWKAVLNCIKSESDITIKKQAVDLLYAICTESNVKPIVDEMLNLLEYEGKFPEDVMLQAVALAERFSNDHEWYFDTILNLLQIYGDNINDSLWHSLIKVVIENDSIQEYAAKSSFAALQERNCHDTVTKVAGYILGEFGYLIGNDPRSNCIFQFNALKEKFPHSSLSTKAVLLTTFMKFYNSYPDMKDDVQLLLKDNIKNENEEIQQRAVEYFKLIQMASKNLLATVLDAMPSSMRSISPIIAAIENNKFQNFSMEQVKNFPRRKSLTKFDSHCSLISDIQSPNEVKVRMTKSASQSNVQHIDYSSSNLVLIENTFKCTPVVTGTLPKEPISPPRISNVSNNQSFLHYLLFNEKSNLYENDAIAIMIENDFKKHFGRFHLKYKSKTENELSEFSTQGNFSSIENECSIGFKPCRSTLPAYGIIEQDIYMECLNVFSERASLILKFALKNQYNEITLILPLTLNKFVEPEIMTPDVFNKRWQNFDSVNQEIVKDFTAKYSMIYGVTRHKLEGFRLAVIEDVSPEHFHCSGILYTRENRIGVLVQLERDILKNKYCCRVRSSEPMLSRVISDLLSELL